MSFDAAQWEILAPARGARVVTGAPGIHRDPERLIATVTAHGVTAVQCVPTLLRWGHRRSGPPEASLMEGGTRFHLDTSYHRPCPFVTRCDPTAPRGL